MTKENILVTSIKPLKDGTAIVKYKKSTEESAQDITYTGTEKITEEFFKTFQENKEGLIGCLPVLGKDSESIEMNVIRFDYGKTDKLQNALYSAKYAFNKANNAVININTPLLPIYKEEFDEKTFCISGKYEELLYKTIELAKAYINGDTRTKQMKIEVAG